MVDVGVKMKYFDDFNGEINNHGKEMLGAAAILKTWIKDMNQENVNRSNSTGFDRIRPSAELEKD